MNWLKRLIAALRAPGNHRVVTEDVDELGYYLPLRNFRGASKTTKSALTGIMPEAEWDQMRENALDAHEAEGGFYYEESA